MRSTWVRPCPPGNGVTMRAARSAPRLYIPSAGHTRGHDTPGPANNCQAAPPPTRPCDIPACPFPNTWYGASPAQCHTRSPYARPPTTTCTGWSCAPSRPEFGPPKSRAHRRGSAPPSCCPARAPSTESCSAGRRRRGAPPRQGTARRPAPRPRPAPPPPPSPPLAASGGGMESDAAPWPWPRRGCRWWPQTRVMQSVCCCPSPHLLPPPTAMVAAPAGCSPALWWRCERRSPDHRGRAALKRTHGGRQHCGRWASTPRGRPGGNHGCTASSGATPLGGGPLAQRRGSALSMRPPAGRRQRRPGGGRRASGWRPPRPPAGVAPRNGRQPLPAGSCHRRGHCRRRQDGRAVTPARRRGRRTRCRTIRGRAVRAGGGTARVRHELGRPPWRLGLVSTPWAGSDSRPGRALTRDSGVSRLHAQPGGGPVQACTVQ